ncbi:uncharacterized protein C7orf57 homolog isoform X2 [Sardina pilchardus]|uniref:uncharacterized protein C7orf57 homolog isoform X2 n=1 Tax=Sardina pilchardus TaxID=27697 RepID=UPI002E1513CC
MSSELNYRRAKPGKKTFQGNPANGVVGPTSQIPGLCQTADTAPEERTTGRRVGIFESDSDYVKLAKGGGHKGLLSHDDVEEGQGGNPSYRPPEWFSANSGSRSPLSPSQASSADSTSSNGGHKSSSKGAARLLAAPFGTDEISPWDQDTDAFTAGKDKVGNATNQMEKLTMNDSKEFGKYKKISHDKKTAKDQVSMSKLLSFGYMEEDEKKSVVDDDASSMTSEQTSTIAPEDELE